MISIGIRPGEPDAVIEQRLLAAIRSHLNSVLHRAAPAIRRRIGEACDNLIRRTPEYASLVQGDLMGELGLPDPEERLDRILAAIKRGVDVGVIPLRVEGKRLVGGLSIGILRADYQDILSASAASYVSQPSGVEVPWLGYLIGGGDRILVAGYHSEFDLTTAEKLRSRSGRALMRSGGGWRVPPWAAGFEDDNFLTRAFDLEGAARLVEDAIRREIESRLA